MRAGKKRKELRVTLFGKVAGVLFGIFADLSVLAALRMALIFAPLQIILFFWLSFTLMLTATFFSGSSAYCLSVDK